MANDRNGNPITPGTSYVLIGTALRDDGATTLLDLGQRVVSATTNELARFADIGGGGGHSPVTVTDSSSINFTLTGQDVTAVAIFGTASGTVCEGNDARLGDARTPTAHTHSAADVASGTLGAARLPQFTGGAVTSPSAGSVVLNLGSDVVTSSELADDAVSTSKIRDDAVEAAKIAAGAVSTAKLGGDITAAGKAILDDADAAAQRTTLALGTAATQNTFGSGDPLGVLTAIASFAGLIHTHAPTDITGASSDGQVLRRASGVVGWGTIPSTSVTGLGTAATQNTYGSGDPLGVFTAIAAFAGLTHTHNGTDAPQLSAANIASGTLAVARGGTGQTSYTTGDILYWNGSALAKLAIGSEGQVLKVESGVPKWSDP